MEIIQSVVEALIAVFSVIVRSFISEKLKEVKTPRIEGTKDLRWVSTFFLLFTLERVPIASQEGCPAGSLQEQMLSER